MIPKNNFGIRVTKEDTAKDILKYFKENSFNLNGYGGNGVTYGYYYLDEYSHLRYETMTRLIPSHIFIYTLKQLKLMETTQKVSLAGMKEIYDIACNEWKKTITDWTNPFSDTTLTDEQVKKMYDASDSKQRLVLDKYLTKPTSNLYEKAKKALSTLVLPYQEPSNASQKCINATVKLFKLAEVYNEGKKLDWNNTNQNKYFMYKFFSDGGLVVSCVAGCCGAGAAAGLYYADRTSMEEVMEKFPEIVNDYFMI